MRKAIKNRQTTETQIQIEINLDGNGESQIDIPLGFLKHMLELFAKQSLIDLKIKAKGDIEVDDHHLIEDLGIVLGQSIKEALGDKKGITRYGSKIIPMDEVLCLCAIDLSGRYSFETNYQAKREIVNDFSTEMIYEFFNALAVNAMINLHIQYLNPGRNEHHRIEGAFKAFARAIRQAIETDPRTVNQIPSTKGKL
ncbi:imidazoleglycerol-phosphate dehydratase HisB [Patescibacteria group bacterium]